MAAPGHALQINVVEGAPGQPPLEINALEINVGRVYRPLWDDTVRRGNVHTHMHVHTRARTHIFTHTHTRTHTPVELGSGEVRHD